MTIAVATRERSLPAPTPAHEELYEVCWNPEGHALLTWARAEAQLARVGGYGGERGTGGAEWVHVQQLSEPGSWVQVLGDPVVGIILEIGGQGDPKRVGAEGGATTLCPLPEPYAWWAFPVPQARELWSVPETLEIARTWMLENRLEDHLHLRTITDMRGRR